MGQRTEANLRRALERMAQPGDGIPLAVALPVAETLRDRLAGVAGVERVEVAGSLRRMKAAVHDIDLLAAAADPASVNRAFTELPQVAEVAALGDTKASVRTRDGLQVDLRTVQPEVWGAALQYFTGSAAHNVRIRERAVKAGLKLSEYGLFERGGELVVATDEEVVYDRLGMAFIPPVLREDRGEVDAARRGQLPALVSLADVGGDFHCHTDLSPDGTAPLEVMVDAGPGPRLPVPGHHRPRREARPRRGQPRPAAGPARPHPGPGAAPRRHRPAHGAELNIGGDGSLDYDDEFLDGFDVLVASVHERLDQPRELLTARLVAACEHPAVNVVGHPTGRASAAGPPATSTWRRCTGRPPAPAPPSRSTAPPPASTWATSRSASPTSSGSCSPSAPTATAPATWPTCASPSPPPAAAGPPPTGSSTPFR
jgi:DNA polymerase (family 10)